MRPSEFFATRSAYFAKQAARGWLALSSIEMRNGIGAVSARAGPIPASAARPSRAETIMLGRMDVPSSIVSWRRFVARRADAPGRSADHAAVAQAGDVGGGIAELAQHRIGVLAEQRRALADAAR